MGHSPYQQILGLLSPYGLVCCLVWSLLILVRCGPSSGHDTSQSLQAKDRDLPSSQVDSESPPFTDVTAEVGVDFRHVNGASGVFFFPEIMGSGGALIDYDNDGDLDLFFAQGHMIGQASAQDALLPHVGSDFPGDTFYRNDLHLDADGRPRLVFTQVTDQVGISGLEYGLGSATGDFDNDGYVDLYVTNFGRNTLYRNNGDGTFSDITETAGVGDPAFSVSAAFVDIDHDGFLDLYVGNYIEYALANNKNCFSRYPDYCHPNTYPPAQDRLYRNNGDGTFTDITESSGIDRVTGRALGVIAADFDRDGLVDLYVANDATENQLWMNQGNAKFKDRALLAGSALNEMGKAEASMGVDAADFDHDGDQDLFMTHNRNETNTLYVNDGNGFFSDSTVAAGLAAPSLAYTGFGTAWFDYDNDGNLDLFVANGAVSNLYDQLPESDPYPYHQPNQLFRHKGGGSYEEVQAFVESQVSRGALFGDLDNDGDTDIVVVNNSGYAQVLRNNLGQDSSWISLRFVDRKGGRDMLGTSIAVQAENGKILWRRVHTDGSYASANDPRVLVGLGKAKKVKVTAIWPNGDRESWQDLSANQQHTLVMGSGNPQAIVTGREE